jgi:hypothetical protein
MHRHSKVEIKLAFQLDGVGNCECSVTQHNHAKLTLLWERRWTGDALEV